nr:adenosine deaminase [Algicola sagamiensis]
MRNQKPLVDLHRHLDGNIRAETILALGQSFSVDLPANTLESLRPFVQVMEPQPDLMAFIEKLDLGLKVLGDLEACRRVAYENVEDLKRAHIDYAELRFSPYVMAMTHHLPMEGVVEAVIDGVKAGERDFDVQTNLIGILCRTHGVEHCSQELDALLTHKDNIVALDLAGNEKDFPGELFVSHFQKARDEGLNITIHAGEADGPHSVKHAIDVLGATRIGHGINAIHDPALMEEMVRNDIVLEVCLTSNLQTNTVPSIASHPIREFLKQGLTVTLNTDDPAVEGIELLDEYQIAQDVVGLSDSELMQIQENGVQAAFLSESGKTALYAKCACSQ